MPAATEIQSMRPKQSVSSRRDTGGITSIAAIIVTPSTFIVAAIVAVSMTASIRSMRPVRTPETSATSGSNVENSS